MPKCKFGKCDTFLNENLVENLECPVCLNYLVPPIYQCSNGHVICNSCRPRVNRCPTCKVKFINNRNLILEKVFDFCRFPCRHKEYGCDLLLFQKSLKSHEEDCGYQSMECPIKMGCLWKDRVDFFSLHLLNDDHQHSAEYVLVQNDINSLASHRFHVRLKDLFVQNKYIVIGDKVFCLVIEYKGRDITDSNIRVLAGVKFYGPKSDANKYKYKITITSVSSKCKEDFRELSFTNRVHWYNISLSDVYDECFNFENHHVKKFASSDGYFGVNVQIQEI